MTKHKLQLSEFLSNMDTSNEVTIRKESFFIQSYPLSEFYSKISSHTGFFYIDDLLYTNVISSTNNMYFFNEASDDEVMIIFDPIIDIKCNNSNFTIFYYPNQIINISLKDSNVKEASFKKIIKG